MTLINACPCSIHIAGLIIYMYDGAIVITSLLLYIVGTSTSKYVSCCIFRLDKISK